MLQKINNRENYFLHSDDQPYIFNSFIEIQLITFFINDQSL